MLVLKTVPSWSKFLFTTAKFPEIEKAFTWNGHVSPPNSTARKVTPVRHIQMDIGVKDSSIKGVSSDNKNWLMLTYYYDASYNPKVTDLSPNLAAIWNSLPEGFKHMRPQGTQVGFY